MSALKKIAARAGRVAAVAAVTVGLTAGLATAPASAAPPPSGANLDITAVGSGQYRVSIWGLYPMSEYDAHGYINNLGTGATMEKTGQPGGMRYHIYGDDSGHPDPSRWYNFYPGAGYTSDSYLYATPQGIRYYRSVVVPASTLNEDNGFFDKIDEIYVDAILLDGDLRDHRVYSNVVFGQF